MPKQTRRKTRHTGVFIVDLSSGDQTFYIRYKREGKLIEERAGRKKQGMTSAKANKIRAERISGKTESNVEKRKRNQTQARRFNLDDLWEEYLKIKKDHVKAVSTDLSRYKNHISECVKSYSLVSSRESAQRKFALICVRQAAGRSSEVAWVLLESLQWDPLFQQVICFYVTF